MCTELYPNRRKAVIAQTLITPAALARQNHGALLR